MKFVFICCVLIAVIFNGATAYNRQHAEKIVAAEQNLQSRTDKQERLIVEDIVPADKNLQSRTGEQERLIINGIVAAKHDPESRMDQTKLQFVVKA